MIQQTELEQEVAALIVGALYLEDVDPTTIDPEQPLFRDGLGLDSIDALELALTVSECYGVKIRSDDEENNVRIFSSLKSLSQFIDQERHSSPDQIAAAVT